MEHAIETSARLTAPLRHVRTVVTEEPGILVAADATASGRGGGPFSGALAMDIGDGTKVEQAVVGELGPPLWADDALVVPVRWQPASHEHLLPAFAGEFELTASPTGTRLVLRGLYTIPLGPAGRVGDRVVGRRVAQRVLDGHLESVAARLDEAARHGAAAEQELFGPPPATETFIG